MDGAIRDARLCTPWHRLTLSLAKDCSQNVSSFEMSAPQPVGFEQADSRGQIFKHSLVPVLALLGHHIEEVNSLQADECSGSLTWSIGNRDTLTDDTIAEASRKAPLVFTMSIATDVISELIPAISVAEYQTIFGRSMQYPHLEHRRYS